MDVNGQRDNGRPDRRPENTMPLTPIVGGRGIKSEQDIDLTMALHHQCFALLWCLTQYKSLDTVTLKVSSGQTITET